MLDIDFPEKLECLFNEDPRYIVLYGGRAGLKSWSIARALLIRAAKKKLRVLCCREVQRSIAESVHHLLKSQIEALGLSNFYMVLENEIRGRNGSQFSFVGIRNDPSKIKSYEDYDLAWIEEAANVSKQSYDILVPTIRKKGSQIVVSFNPEISEDETYQRFIVSRPENSIVVKTTYRDNPWLSDEIKKEIEECRMKRPEDFKNIWEGDCRSAIEGAIFAKELAQAEEEGRITSVPYDPSVPVNTYWDLGHSDQTAIFMAQIVGMEYRILQCYANSQEKLHHYIKYLQDQPYTYGNHYLPHDAAHEQLGSDRTIEKQARDALKNVFVVPRVQRKANAIEAARSLFPLCYFDKEGCSDGLSALRHYRYAFDEQTGKVSANPVHDIYSHYSDSFECLAMSLRKPKEKIIQKQRKLPRYLTGRVV